MAVNNTSSRAGTSCTRIPRFSVHENLCAFYMDVPQSGSLLAVSGRQKDTDETFIDLFMITTSPGLQQMLSPQPYHSELFPSKGTDKWRCVCLWGDSKFITSYDDTIESYDTKDCLVVERRKFTGEAHCMTVTSENLFVGLYDIPKVIMFDSKLNQMTTITLKGMGDRDWPDDITVTDNLFICTGYGKAFMYNNMGDMKHEYKAPNQQYKYAQSITGSKKSKLIYILWTCGVECLVVVYSIRAYKYFPSGCHFLASFKVPNDSCRIRINDKVHRLFVVTHKSGEVHERHTLDIVNPENRLSLLECLIAKDDCQGLLEYFKVPGDKAKIIITSHKPSRFLIQHLRETGVISAEDIKALVRACKSLEISKVVEAWRNYEEFERDRKQLEKKLELQTYLRQLNEKLKKSEDERQALFGNLKEKRYENKSLIDRLDAAEQEKREVTNKLQESNEEVGKLTTRLERVNGEKSLQINKLTEKLKISDDEKQKLIRTLETTEDKRMHCEEILVAKEMEMKEVKNRLTIDMEHHLKELEETKFMLRAANDELIKSQINYAKESMALQEVLEQTKKAVNDYEMQKERSLLNGKEISLLSEESTTLAADYGRFLVDVADDLTLDNTLTLATLLGLPQSEKDMLRRISLIETPGITLINSLKARNIINMYDVTNLQKGLMHLHLYSTNAKYLVPYQEKVDPFLFEDNQLEELLDWPETFTALKVPNIPQETKESKHGHLEEKSMEKIEREEISRPRQYSQQMHQPYMEQKINSGGGIITIMGVHLSIPSGALPTDHLIAITIIDDPNMPFLESYQRCRVTPLIKLEPEGLNLTKAAILTIPHSAFIPKPEGHGVSLNIFAGPVAQEESQKGWREDKSLKWKLDQETIRTEVKTLSYIFATLVSEGTEQQHRFRVVPLIDAILNVKDDAVITVCFCQDSAKEYKRLLDDHKSKLTLGNYTTFQVGRNLSKERDTESYLSISLSLQTGNYHLAKKEAIKSVHIDHLCAARSFSHDFRLKRVTDCGSTAMVHVTLKISHGENRTALNLQAKVNNILLSAKIQCQESPKNVEQYENMKENVSLLLDKYHCERLSTFFHLTPAEEKTLQTNENPGKVLMKTLEQRGLLMPNKVITLYESLNAINQSYIGRRVLDYIDTSKEKKSLEANCNEQEDTNVANEKGSGIQERNIALTKNAELLIKEGYIRLDVQRALKLSHGNLDLGRRLLLLAKYEHDRVPDCQESTLYREDFIDEHGGELYIAGIHVRVPAGALHVGRIVNLSVSTASECRGPIPNKSMRLTPFVKLGPEGLTFRKPVSMTVPHCALITNNQKDLDVYKGVTQKAVCRHFQEGIDRRDKTMKWNLLERKNFPCSMNSSSLQIEIERACGFISPHIPYHREMKKRICVVPIMHRICSLSDALQICLWFHNDNKSEHEYLVNEVKNSNATPIHDPVSFQLKSTASTLPVRISSGTSQCSPRPRKLDIDTNSLWLQNRHKVEFQLQNKDSRDTINLEIESRRGVPRKCFFHIKVYVQIDKLLRSEQIIPPSQPVSPADCITAFKQLCQKLAEKLDEEQCSQLASTFQLSDHIPSRTEEFRKPGTLLLKTLVETSLISCSTISTFENALTNIGNEACAKLVRDFRKGNPVITQPIMCPELFSPLSQ